MSFQIDIKKSDYITINLNTCVAAAKKALAADMYQIEATSKKDYLMGPRPIKLGVVTGVLRSSVKGTVESVGDNLRGSLGFGPQAWYGELHEEGKGGQQKRAFLIPAIEDHIENVETHILDVIDKALKEIEK